MVALYGRGEAALRAEGEALQRDITAGLLDARSHFLDALQTRLLGGYQAEHNDAIVGYVAQRLKSARALVVVFEQETLEMRLLEDASNWLIITSGIEFALVVTPANMHTKGDAGMA